MLIELADEDQLDAARLADRAEHFSLAAVRRLGYLLDVIGQHALAEPLHQLAERRRKFPPDLLAPGSGDRGDVDGRWRVRANTNVGPDL